MLLKAVGKDCLHAMNSTVQKVKSMNASTPPVVFLRLAAVFFSCGMHRVGERGSSNIGVSAEIALNCTVRVWGATAAIFSSFRGECVSVLVEVGGSHPDYSCGPMYDVKVLCVVATPRRFSMCGSWTVYILVTVNQRRASNRPGHGLPKSELGPTMANHG